MKKTSISQRLRVYFVATTLCLTIISTSMGEGLIKTTFGYGYGYGYGNNKTDDIVNNNDTANDIIKDSEDKETTVSTNTVNSHKKKDKKKEKKRLKNSQNSVKKGEILVQSGKGFKKNSKLRLYFSKPDGTFYPPVIVKTDSKGKFSVKYLANKPAGKYKWYAVVPTSGKKIQASSYTIVK
ncbi:MAG: hypothetical protein RBS77_00145 [Candidatus Moranbacteria bacterium]|nr:hypothetical protein [Candidatus Moranbacteria bacterium]